MKLKRGIGLFSSINIVMGSVIGSGIFFVVGDITSAVPSPLPALSIWVTAGFVSFLGGLCYAELGSMYPGAGGSYLYFKEAFHPLVGFLFGWAIAIVIQPGSIAAVAVAFAGLVQQIFGLSEFELKFIACAAIIIFTVANMFGVKRGANILDSFTSIKSLVLFVIGFGGLIYFFKQGDTLAPPQNYLFSFSSYGVALIAAFWAFDGWVNLTYVAGEIENPKRNVPLGMFLGIILILSLYLIVNFAYYQTLSIAEITSSKFVAGDSIAKLFGEGARPWLQWAIVISTLGCVSALILTGARITYAMGVDGVFPKIFSKLDTKYQTPRLALSLQMLISILLVWWGTYDQLFTYLMAAAFLFYGLAPAALITLRKTHSSIERPYRVPLYPFVPILYILCCAALLLNACIEKPTESLLGLLVVGSGIPVFLWMQRRPDKI